MPEPRSSIAFPPRAPAALVSRPRLVRWLDERADHPIVIVRSPAGGGKSTLLAEWARSHPGPGVWVGLDRSARGRLGFWRRVVQAIVDARLVPEDSPLHGLVVSAEITDELASLLQRGLATALPFHLVLDDFHEVADARVQDDLHWLLASGAPLHVVIGTRTLSGLEEPEQMAKVDTTVLPSADLAFTPAEVRDVAGLLRADDGVDKVVLAFGGWPLPTRAALLLLGHEGTTVDQAIDRVRDTGRSVILDDPDDPGYAEFLLRASVARTLNRSLALELGGEDAAGHLERAEREGIGTWTDGPAGPAFAVHPYLRKRMEAEFVARLPDQVAEVRRAYARDRSSRGDALEAARQYAAIGDATAIVDLIRRHYGELVLSVGAFVEILRTLDRGELRRHPELLTFWLAASYSDTTIGRPRLAQMASLISAVFYARYGGGDPVERASLLITLLTAQRVSGHFDQALKTAERLASALAFLDDDGREALSGLLPTALTHIGTTYFYQEQADRAEEFFRAGAAASAQARRPWAQTHGESMQDLIVAMRGDHRTLRRRLESADGRATPRGWRGTYSGAGYHLASAFEALERFDSVAARGQLAQLSRHEHTIEHWPLIARLRALAHLVDGAPYLGLQTLVEDVAAHADRPPISRSMSALLAAVRADLLLADRQAHRAVEELRAIRQEPTAQAVRARAQLVLGNLDEAIGLAAPLAWSETSVPRMKAEALLVIAIASHRLNRSGDSHDAIRRVTALLETYDLRRPLMTVPRNELIAVFSSAGIDHAALLAGVPDLFAPTSGSAMLTPTELRVLELLEATGRTDELAAQLYISTNTVKTHLRQVYRKLGVRSREEALGAARLHGLLREERADPTDRRSTGT